MSTFARASIASLALWLIASWTVPVCCLSMVTSPAPQGPDMAMPMNMAGHQHHHHQMSDSDRSSHRVSPSGPYAQGCQATSSVGVMTLPAGRDLAGFHRAVIAVTAPLVAAPLSRYRFEGGVSSPPDDSLALSDRALPLRI